MSSQGYSTFFFGSSFCVGSTTRMYSAASFPVGNPVIFKAKGTNVRASCDFRKTGSISICMSVGAGWPAMAPSTILTIVSISSLSCLLRFLSSLCAEGRRGQPRNEGNRHDERDTTGRRSSHLPKKT